MQDSIYQVLEEAKLSGWEQIRGCQRLRMHGGFDYKGVGGRRETFAVVSPAFLRNSNGRLDLPGPTQEAA